MTCHKSPSRHSPDSTLLAGDIGGTKVDLVLFKASHGIRNPIIRSRFRSEDHEDFYSVLKLFFQSFPEEYRISAAAFGVAGPVISSRARITNLDWEISTSQIQTLYSISRVHLVNDLVAIAAAVPSLNDDDLVFINRGEPVPGGAMAVAAPGTGLGEAFLVWNGSEYIPFPSEGGHTDFAPVNDIQRDLFDFLHEKYGHVSYERVCSGMGMPDLFAFLHNRDYAECPGSIVERIESTDDPTPLIIAQAMESPEPCPLCHEVVNLFVSVLGAEAGNLALKVLATGGLYLGGGLPPRILPYLTGGRFMESFLDKGRFSGFLGHVPVAVITFPDAPLLGAGQYALRKPI